MKIQNIDPFNPLKIELIEFDAAVAAKKIDISVKNRYIRSLIFKYSRTDKSNFHP